MSSKQSRGGLTASDMKSMTVADNGDLLFFHYGDIKGSKVDARKGTPKPYTTDKRVYTTNYYYTNESDREGMVGGKVNVVRVPADKVYSFNKDVLGLFDEAKKNSEAQSKGQAFSPNRQADFIAQLAAKNGFDMMVAKWGNGYRAESPKALPIDAALTKQMRTNGSLSTTAVDDKLNQDIYNAAASKANGNSEKYRSAFYGIKDITAKDIMENPILSRGIPKRLADKYNIGQVRSKQSRSSNEDIVSASVNVAPLYSTKVSNVGQAELIHNSELYKRYKNNNERLAKMFNLKVISQGDGVGGYEFSNGDAVMEATTVVNVRGKFSDIVNYAAVVGALAPEVQDATIAGMHVDENDENHNADRIAIGVDNVDAAMKAAEDSGFDRDGFTLIDNEISFFDVFFDPKGSKKQKEKTKDFKNKIDIFEQKYIEYGGKITSQSKRAVRSEYIDNTTRRDIISKIRSSGIQYGYDRSGLRDALAKAEERNTRYTSWKYLDKSETAKEYRNLRQLQFDAAANGTSITDAQRKRISELEKRMSKILSTTFKSDANEYEKAKLEVDAIANDVAGLVEDGYKSEFPIKRPSRAAVKTVRWYSSQPNLLGDGARANVVVNTDTDADFLYDGLLTRFPSPTERNEKAKTELGYPKRLIEIKTSNGKLAEIQVMTTQGYLAKDGVKYFPEDAKSKAADSLKEVRGRLGWEIPDGIGHYFYEIHRDPNVSKSLRDEAEVVSNKYYDAFLNKDSKLTDAEFRADVQAFKDNVDKANKSNWDEGNTGESPKELDTYLASEGNQIKSKQSRVSDILNDTFNQEAKKTKIDKLDVKALARKVVDIVKSSKLYTQTDDIERENAIIDFLKSKGIVQKRVIEPRNKNIISVNEVTALKDQIRLEIKAANDGAKSIEDAVKKIGEIIKGLAKGKKISVTSAKALINKFSNMNTANKDSVNSILDYAEKIFNDAEYADKVSQVKALNSLMRRVKNNDKIPSATRSIGVSFAKINPEAVSDIDAHLEAAKKIKDALVGVKENGVKIRKAIDINAMADYLKTAMAEQDAYDAKNPTTTRVVEPLDEEKALEYLAAEHDSLLQAAKAVAPSAVLTDAEMAQLKNFLKLSIDDFETMAEKIAAVEALDNFVKNADMGKIPFILNNQQVNANINRGVKAIMPKLSSMSLMWFSEQKAKIRGWFDNKTWYRDSPKDFSKTLAYFMNQSIRRVDNLIGNFKNYDVFNNTFKSLASGYAKYLFKINSMDADVIFQKVLSSFNGDMYKAVQHCYKMTMYKLQLEYESNIGNREVIPAMMHLEKTLKDGNLTKKDKAELRKLIEEFSTTDATTGEVKIDTEKIWDSFNKVEQKAAETLADYYAKLTPYAKHVAVSLRGVPFNPRANYMMLNVINQQSSLSATPPSASQVFTKGSTKAGTIIERDGTAHAVSLDPYNTFNAANRDVMMDYCLLNPIKTVEAIFKKLVEDTANDEKANDVAKSLEFIFNEITESIINRSFVMSDKVWTDVFNFIKKVGARYMLAKIDKAPAEFAGNAIFAGIAYTENILEGIKNNAYQRNFELSQAMEALDSYSIDRLYPHKGQSGAFLDPNSFDIDVRDKKHFIDGASNVAQVVYYNSLLQAQKGGEAVSDFLVTAPDLAVGRMAWEGTLRLEFKKETGTEIDLEKVIKKDYDYLEKYKDALDKATTEADRVIVDIASSKNPFVGMAKESVRRDYNSFMTSIDGFLRSFSKNENQVGMDAAYALIKSGKIDRARGVRLLAAILARGGVYNSVRAKVLLLLTGLGFAIVNGITGGDDSEEKRRRRARLQLEYMNVEGDDWAEKSPVVAGKKILYAGNIYEVVTGGITSANPPSDTSGKIITDGTAKYKWIGTIPRIQGSITGIKDNVSMGNSLRTYDKQFIEKAKKAAAPEETMAHSFNKGAAQSAVGIILGRNSGAIFSNLFMAPAVEYANEKFIHPAMSSDPYDKYRDGIMYSKMIDRSRKDPELNFIIDNTGVFNPFFKAAVTGYRMFDNKYGDRLRELNKKIEAHEKGVKVPREESSKEKYYGFIAERDALLEKQKPVKAMMAKNIIIAAFTVTGVLPSGKTIDAIADKTLQDKILSPSDMDDIIKKIEDARNYSGGGSVRLENAKENDKVLVYPDIYTDYTLQGRKIPAKKP
jgi:hypothetical protein